MKKNRKVIALILIMVMCMAVLSSCGNNSGNDAPTATPTPVPGDSPTPPQTMAPVPTEDDVKFSETIDMILANSNIAVIDPFNPSGGVDACTWTYNLIYDRLVYPSFGSGYEPYLATSWDTDDYKTYVFHLRDDVYFTNGEKFTADDVIWTIEHALESVGSVAYNNWSTVAETNKIDEYTLEIILKDINADFIFNVAQPNCGIVNKKAMTDDPVNGVQIGTGAFYVTEFVTNNSVSLQRNDNYWAEPAITKYINMQFVPEQSSRSIMLLNGEAQLCFRVSDEDVDTFKTDPNFQLFSFAMATPNAMFFNLNDPIVGDPNFRLAIASALDREDMTYGAVGDYGMPVTDGTVWGWDTEFRNTELELVPYDIDKAKEYLALSPYKGETIEIATAIASTIKASEIIQQQLSKIGINIEVNQMDPASLNAYTQWDNNKAQIVVYGILFSNVASSVKSTVYPNSTGNRSMYDNPEVNAMIDEAAASTDPVERERLYKEIQKIVHDDMPYIGLFWRMSSVVAAKGVGGFELPSNALYDLRYVYWQLED